ncbi:YjaG family protein [Oceanospirillaceae bacterium]|nr:YjaG family protein [Oceanospirillaceae bacterium]
MYFDQLYAPLKDMQDWQQIAFSAALCERIFPHYALFDSLSETNQVLIARTALDQVWKQLSLRGNMNADTQLTKVEAIVHSEEDESFGAGLAFDALVALMATLHCVDNASYEDAASVAHLSRESVAKFVELHAKDELSDEQLIRHISTHELMVKELAFQSDVMQLLISQNVAKSSQIDQLKLMAMADGVSNIGISMDHS